MQNKQTLVILLSAFIIGSFILLGFYISKPSSSISGKVTEPKVIEPITNSFIGEGFVTKIIDGDTVIIGGESIRLLGIDADERGYPCYDDAKERIEELILNKEVILEEDGEDKDQYGRYLRYIFLDEENINLKLVEEGLAVARFSPQNTKYRQEILEAEKQARENKIGCKWGEKQVEEEPEIEIIEKDKEETNEPGLNIIGACNAGNYIGEEKIVEGRIVDTYRSNTNTIFLNFEKPYPNHCFTAVIFSSYIYKFPENPEDYYYGKTARINGEIKEYQGKPEIILKDIGQIEIV